MLFFLSFFLFRFVSQTITKPSTSAEVFYKRQQLFREKVEHSNKKRLIQELQQHQSLGRKTTSHSYAFFSIFSAMIVKDYVIMQCISEMYCSGTFLPRQGLRCSIRVESRRKKAKKRGQRLKMPAEKQLYWPSVHSSQIWCLQLCACSTPKQPRQ